MRSAEDEELKTSDSESKLRFAADELSKALVSTM
jgi:hypothetical protein